MLRFRMLLPIFAAAALNACGGGSGSGGGAIGNVNPPVVSGPLLIITAENAEQTSGEVINALEGAFGAGDSALDFGGALGARVEADTAAASTLALDIAQSARDKVVSAADSVAIGAIITETEDCTAGGSTTVSIDTGSMSQVEFSEALQEGQIPAGTSVTMRFDDCMQPGQPTLSGGFTVVFQQFTVDGEIGLDAMTLEFSASFDALSTPEGTINGDISFLLVSDAGTTSIEIFGDGLSFASTTDTLALLEYLVSAFQDSVALVESFDFTLNISSLGQVTVQGVEPWRTNNFAEYPSSGALRISGADGTSITVTALDEVSVQLEVDSDGDNVANVTIITTWVELNAAEG